MNHDESWTMNERRIASSSSASSTVQFSLCWFNSPFIVQLSSSLASQNKASIDLDSIGYWALETAKVAAGDVADLTALFRSIHWVRNTFCFLILLFLFIYFRLYRYYVSTANQLNWSTFQRLYSHFGFVVFFFCRRSWPKYERCEIIVQSLLKCRTSNLNYLTFMEMTGKRLSWSVSLFLKR